MNRRAWRRGLVIGFVVGFLGYLLLLFILEASRLVCG